MYKIIGGEDYNTYSRETQQGKGKIPQKNFNVTYESITPVSYTHLDVYKRQVSTSYNQVELLMKTKLKPTIK